MIKLKDKEDEEEKLSFKDLVNFVNNSNTSIGNNDNAVSFADLVESINPSKNIENSFDNENKEDERAVNSIDDLTENEKQYYNNATRQGRQDYINLLTAQAEKENQKKEQGKQNYINRVEQTEEDNKKAREQAKRAATNIKQEPTLQVGNNSSNTLNNANTTNMSIANNNKTIKNVDTSKMTTVKSSDVQAMGEAIDLNKEIAKGGTNKFNAAMNIITRNLSGGSKQAYGGIANFVLTNIAAGIKGAEGISLLFNNKEAANMFNSWYNNVLDTSSEIKSRAEKEANIAAQIDDGTIRTAGQVTNTSAEMITNAVTAEALGIPGSVLQGISVAGRSTQEELDENKNDIVKAMLVGDIKGGISHLTESIFDANILTRGASKSSIQKLVDEAIYDHIKGNLKQEFANKAVGIIGENLEEVLEDNLDMVVDAYIKGEGFPTWEEWKKNTSETAKVTTLSTALLTILGLGGESFKNKKGAIIAEKMQRIVDNGGYEIKFNNNSNSTQGLFFKLDTNPDGSVRNVTAVTGEAIDNPNKKVNVSPVIIKNEENGYYNIIDSNTGAMIDATPYGSILSAKSYFNSKMINLDETSVRELNNDIDNFNTSILLQSVETINNIPDDNTLDNVTNNTDKLIASFSLQEEYSRNQVGQVWEYMSQNQRNIIPNNNGDVFVNIEALDSNDIENNSIIIREIDVDDNVLWESDVIDSNRKGNYSANDLINAISSIPEYQSITSQNAQETNSDNLTSNTTNNISQEINSNTSQNDSNFYNPTTKYVVNGAEEFINRFNDKKTYTEEQISDIVDEEYDNIVSYDNQGNIEEYIDFETEGNTLQISLRDGNTDEIIKATGIEANKNGRYPAEKIKNAIRDITIDNENRPIKGQQDIEGNEVRSMKKGKKIAKNENAKYNNNKSEVDIDGQRNGNNGQTISRVQEGKNISRKSQNERIYGEIKKSQSRGLLNYQKQQQRKQGKEFRAIIVKEENQTQYEQDIVDGIKETTGLDLGVFETNKNTTESAFYEDNVLFIKHNGKGTRKNTNFKAWHEIGHWFKQNKPSSWKKIYDIVDSTVTKQQIEDYKNVLNDKTVFDNMTEEEERKYVIEEIVSDYFGNWANDAENWKDYIDLMTPKYQNLIANITLENEKYYYNIFGSVEQQEQVYQAITEIMKDFIGKDNSQIVTYNETDTAKQETTIKDGKSSENNQKLKNSKKSSFSMRKDTSQSNNLNEGLTEQEQKEYSDIAKQNIKNVRKQLNDWLNLKLKVDEDIKMGNTPDSLLIPNTNIKNLPIDMELDVLVKATGGKHSISLDEIAKIPRRIRKSYISNEWL